MDFPPGAKTIFAAIFISLAKIAHSQLHYRSIIADTSGNGIVEKGAKACYNEDRRHVMRKLSEFDEDVRKAIESDPGYAAGYFEELKTRPLPVQLGLLRKFLAVQGAKYTER